MEEIEEVCNLNAEEEILLLQRWGFSLVRPAGFEPTAF